VLYPRWSAAFADHDVTTAQVLLTSQDLDRRDSYLNARATLERLLEMGAVPVINENDTTATDELTFGDNDVLAAQVAILLGAGALYLLTDRDGLSGGDASDPHRIEEVAADTPIAEIDLADIGSSATGRGGIASKIASARMATAAGIDCVIASGREDGVLDDLLAGTARGTRFLPGARREGAFKLWLRHAKPAMGRVTVDVGAARALAERGTSLLPVGVTDATGDFGPGDAVEIWVEGSSTPLGKGIADMSGDDLRRVAGMKSAAVAERLPGCEEVIHRDRLVLLEPVQ
jgi:glutamate 5-kinase